MFLRITHIRGQSSMKSLENECMAELSLLLGWFLLKKIEELFTKQ